MSACLYHVNAMFLVIIVSFPKLFNLICSPKILINKTLNPFMTEAVII